MAIQNRPVRLSIRQIQGAGHRSAHTGESVSTRGIVTGTERNGFWLQEAGKPKGGNASSAVFVFAPDQAGKVRVGDDVSLTGEVKEHVGSRDPKHSLSETQVSDLSQFSILARDQKLPEAVALPSTTHPDETADAFERLEGMRVKIDTLEVTSAPNKYGDVHGHQDGQADTLEVNLKAAQLPGYVDEGDNINGITGHMSYRAGMFQIKAKSVDGIEDLKGRLEKEVTHLVGDARHVTVASFNVENLDARYEDATKTHGMRGDDDVGRAKFVKIADDIVTGLKSPDIIALQEMQDNDGVEKTDETSAQATADMLINHIVAMGGPEYTYVEMAPENHQEGGQPGGNIRVGYLYREDRVSVSSDDDQARHGSDQAFDRTRRSLQAGFVFTGENGASRRLQLFNNHFSSKSGSSAAQGEKAAFDPAAKARGEQAAEIAAAASASGKASDDVVVALGDFNDFYGSPATTAFTDQGFTHFAENMDKSDRYSHGYRGHVGLLDHILVKGAAPEALEGDVVHRNAKFKNRSSDHDPVLVKIEMFSEDAQ